MLFVLAVAFVGYDAIKRDFDVVATIRYVEANGLLQVPQKALRCVTGKALGAAITVCS